MRTTTASTSFASTHRDETESLHLHGHTFHVAVTELGFSEDLDADLVSVSLELHLKSLDDMLVGGEQSLEHMAAWFMERLLLRHPRISLVELWTADNPDVRVGSRRETR